MTAAADGTLSMSTWAVTEASAAALVCAFTARHGRPLAEWLGSQDDAGKAREFMLGLGVHVSDCGCGGDET